MGAGAQVLVCLGSEWALLGSGIRACASRVSSLYGECDPWVPKCVMHLGDHVGRSYMVCVSDDPTLCTTQPVWEIDGLSECVPAEQTWAIPYFGRSDWT